MRAVRFPTLLVMLLALAPSARAASPSPAPQWTLRLLPATSLEYHLTTTDTVTVEASGRSTTNTTSLERTVTRRIVPVPGAPPPGLYEVEQTDRELGLQVGTGTVTLGTARPPARFRIRPDGSGDAGVKLDLVLPPGPVSAGASWEHVAPPSRLAPLELRTAYKLEREEVIAGRRCLVITATITGELTAGGKSLTHRGKARLALDPRAGVLVRAVSDARTIVTEPPDAKGPRRKETHIRSRLELVDRR